jgi:hypothetical protein
VNYFGLKRYLAADGCLAPIEFGELPFEPKRLFYIHSVPAISHRGSHAHKTCHQIIVPVKGGFAARLFSKKDGLEDVKLSETGDALYVEPMTWLELYGFENDNTVCLVIASHPYDIGDYIDDYEDFLKHIQNPV